MSRHARFSSVLATIALALIVLVVVLSGGRSPAKPSRLRLTPVSVAAPIKVGGEPVAVAVGAGAIWVIDAAHQTLIKVDPRTRVVVGKPRRVPGGPFAVAVGAGFVWVACGDGTVRAYDPGTVGVIGRTATIPGANGLAVGEGGVWVSSRRAATVTRIDPRTRHIDAPISVGRGPAAIAVGLGAVWVANADGGSVSRIDPGARRAVATVTVGARQVLALAIDERSVWVVRAAGPDADRTQLVQIDPPTGKLVGDPIAVPGAVPLGVVAGGGIWVTDSGSAIPQKSGGRGGVTRVDPATRKPAGPPLRAGEQPSAIALGEGGVWITSQGAGTLTAIRFARRP